MMEMKMSKTKSEAAKVAVHRVALPKGVKQQAVRMTSGRRGFLRSMTAAEGNYQEWRRGGFKGAWWWQYFKGQDAA
jgi:hypothetical protein